MSDKKTHIVLDEKNFKRMKKNIYNHLLKINPDIKQCQVADFMAKSMGFSSYDHAVHQNFKTDKYVEKMKMQVNYPGVKKIYSWLSVEKEKFSNLLFYRNKTNIERDVEEQIFGHTLNAYTHLFNDLVNYLNIEKKSGLRFCFHDWLDELKSAGFLNVMFIGVRLEDLLKEIFNQFSEEENDLKEIFLNSVADYASDDKNISTTSVLFFNFSELPLELFCKVFLNSGNAVKIKLIKIVARDLILENKSSSDKKFEEYEILFMFNFFQKAKENYFVMNNFVNCNEKPILINTDTVKNNLFLPLDLLEKFLSVLFIIGDMNNFETFERKPMQVLISDINKNHPYMLNIPRVSFLSEYLKY